MNYLTKKIMRAHSGDIRAAREERDRRIVALYAQGLTMAQIGRKRGIRLTTKGVGHVLVRNGVTPRPRGRLPKKKKQAPTPAHVQATVRSLARSLPRSITSASPAVPVSRINTHVMSLHDAVVALAAELGVPLQLHGSTSRRAG